MDEIRVVPVMRSYALEELSVGMSSTYTRTISETDVRDFAELTGDHNPLHLDEEFARTTRFKGRVVHGMLTASFFSTALATMPGPGTVYLSQTLSFRAPVHIGDTVVARVTISEIIREKGRIILKTQCLVGDKVVCDGEAMALVPSRG